MPRAANPGGEWGDTYLQYLTSIPTIILIFAHCWELPNIFPPCLRWKVFLGAEDARYATY